MSNLTINTEYDPAEDVEFKVTRGGRGKIHFPRVAWHNVLNAAELYQVYDWIAENFERPKEPSPLEQFQALNKGDKFIVKFKYVSSSQAPRVKISDTEWVNLLTGGIHTTELLDAADRIEPVV